MTSKTLLAQAMSDHRAGRLQQATKAYQSVLKRRPNDPDALHYYGLLLFQVGRGTEAVRLINRSLDRVPTNPHAWNNLGNILTIQDKVSEARDAYRRVTELAPQMAEAWFNFGMSLRDSGEFESSARHFEKAIEVQPDFLRAYEVLGQLYYRVGHFEEAARVYRQWVARDPENPVARHMAAATSGVNVPERADGAYVAQIFDKYARMFDDNLRQLGYRAPEVLTATLADLVGPRRNLDILDAGCGTGLCGPLLRPLAASLVGVDLSAKMLELARERGDYDELVVGELGAFMSSRPGAFDVIIAADTYEYFGNLLEVHMAAATALRPGGLYLFTVEALEESATDDFRLQVHGRYAHSAKHIQQSLEDAAFTILISRREVLRRERGQDVLGLLVVARRHE